MVMFQEKFYGRKVILADREQVEQASDELFVGSKSRGVALLVVGDPLGATTHTDLKLRAHQLGVPVEVSGCYRGPWDASER